MSFRILQATPSMGASTIRLFCLPYAGGGAAVYRNWGQLAPDWLQICPIEFPGRGWRKAEPLATSLVSLAEAIAAALHPYAWAPYAIFGHSMGALLAYEVATRMDNSAKRQLCKLFVSGSRPPFVPPKRPPVSHLPNPEFIERLREMQGTPEEVLSHPELMELMLPVLRSDFAMCEQYCLQQPYRLHIPITVLAGEQDEDATETDMLPWSLLTRETFRSLRFAGTHFFVREQEAAIVQAISTELEDFRTSIETATVPPTMAG